MIRRPRGLTQDEADLWDEVTRTVRPFARKPDPPSHAIALAAPLSSAVASAPQPTPPLRPSAPAIGSRLTPPIAGPRVTVARTPAPPSPANRGNERKVRRGQVDIDAALDLHGFTQDQAFAALTGFLQRAHMAGAAAVLVVTGQGGRRRDGEAAPGVLKRRLPEWLAAPGLSPLVSGLAAAHRRHGGAGAFYVFLRRRKQDA